MKSKTKVFVGLIKKDNLNENLDQLIARAKKAPWHLQQFRRR